MTASHYFQEGSHALAKESGYLIWINPNGNYHGKDAVDYELCAAISAMSVKLCSPLVKNTVIFVPKNYEFKHPHLKSVWTHIKEWEFNQENFWDHDLLIMNNSPFKYTMRLDSDVVITGAGVNETWHRIWQLGLAITCNIANINGDIIENPYRQQAGSAWITHALTNAYVAVMGANIKHKKFQRLQQGWHWALRNAHMVCGNDDVRDSDKLLGLSVMHSNLIMCQAPFFVHAKPRCVFQQPTWSSVSTLTFANGVWRLSNIAQQLPIHMAEKSLLTPKLAQQLWSSL